MRLRAGSVVTLFEPAHGRRGVPASDRTVARAGLRRGAAGAEPELPRLRPAVGRATVAAAALRNGRRRSSDDRLRQLERRQWRLHRGPRGGSAYSPTPPRTRAGTCRSGRPGYRRPRRAPRGTRRSHRRASAGPRPPAPPPRDGCAPWRRGPRGPGAGAHAHSTARAVVRNPALREVEEQRQVLRERRIEPHQRVLQRGLQLGALCVATDEERQPAGGRHRLQARLRRTGPDQLQYPLA